MSILLGERMYWSVERINRLPSLLGGAKGKKKKPLVNNWWWSFICSPIAAREF